jgi:hypothetical protein
MARPVFNMRLLSIFNGDGRVRANIGIQGTGAPPDSQNGEIPPNQFQNSPKRPPEIHGFHSAGINGKSLESLCLLGFV